MSDNLHRLPDVMDRICEIQMAIRLSDPYSAIVPLFAYDTPVPDSFTPQQFIWTNDLRRTRHDRNVSMRRIEFVDKMRFYIGVGLVQEKQRNLIGHAMLAALIDAFDDDISLGNLVNQTSWVDESESGAQGSTFGYLADDWYVLEQRLGFNIQGPKEFGL